MIVTKENLEKKFVSFYKNVKADKYSDLQIGRVLRGIKNGVYYTHETGEHVPVSQKPIYPRDIRTMKHNIIGY